MTITNQPARNEYTGSAGQTIFNYTFKIFSNTDLNVYVTPAGQVANDASDLTTAYTVSGVGDEAGGSITLTSGVDNNTLVTIVSNVPTDRVVDYQNNGDFIPSTVNSDLDRVVSIAKKVEDLANRSLLTEQSQQLCHPLSLPKPLSQRLLRWKDDCSGMENVLINETWRGIVDNLTSTSSTDSLSANQGNILKGLVDTINATLQSDDNSLSDLQEIVDYIKLNRSDIDSLSISDIAGLQPELDGKASSGHNHDSAYATTGHDHDSDYLGITAKAVDSDKLDGLDSTDFLGATAKAADSDKLDGLNSTDFALSNQVLTDVPVNALFTDTDTNTWRGIVDNLTSTSATDSLSANQGKELKDLVDTINTTNASSGHNHVDDYLGITAKAADSDKLDGLNSTDFLGATAKAVDSDKLDGLNSTDFLGVTAKAADSDKLDGLTGTDFNAVVGTYQTSDNGSGWIKVTLPWNTNSLKMIKFTVSVYSGYKQYTYDISGYMYSTTNQWHNPRCLFKGSGTLSPTVYAGRETNGKAYITIPHLNYSSVIVHSVQSGYSGGTAGDRIDTGWIIAADSSTPNYVTVPVEVIKHSGNSSGDTIKVADGAEATPAITFDSDTDTGFYRSASGNIGVTCNDNTQLQFGAGTYGINMDSAIYLDNNDINGVHQLHFDDNTRFVSESSGYLNFKYGASGAGGIRLLNASGTQRGYLYAASDGIGVLNHGGNWALKIASGSDSWTSLGYNGSAKIQTTTDGVNVIGHTETDKLYFSGSNSYFYSDSTNRVAYTGGDLYIKPAVGNYYNYAAKQYHGNTSGDNHYFRGNDITGNGWSISGAGNASFDNIKAPSKVTSALGYHKCNSSGIITQWGTYTMTSSSTQDFYLCITMPNSLRSVVITPTTDQDDNMNYYVKNKYNNMFRVKRTAGNWSSSNWTFNFIAIGY